MTAREKVSDAVLDIWCEASRQPEIRSMARELRRLRTSQEWVDVRELHEAAKLVILGDMTPDYIKLNINKSAWERLQKAVWPNTPPPKGEAP